MTGTRELMRLIAKRDRVRLPIWVYVIAILVISTVAFFRGAYHTAVDREKFGASVLANPTLRAIAGQIFNTSTLGGLTAWRVVGIGGVAAAMMSILTVVRHTRAEEESGRTELVSAGVVGRSAPLAAALLVVTIANVVAGVIATIGMIAYGTGVAGSVALGSGIAATGIAFAAVAALAVQVPESARSASGIAFGVLGAAFVLRAAGDAGGATWLPWLSPIGWAEQVRPYAGERWWIFGIFSVFVAGVVTLAYALVWRRDLGAGLLRPRLGPPAATPMFRSTFALAWRQHRPALIGWSLAMLAGGLAYGGAANGIGSLVNSSQQMKDVIAKLGGSGGLVDVYLSATFGICGLVAAAYGAQAALRLRSEEIAGRVEPLLATAATRRQWMAGHIVLAFTGTAVVLAASGLGAGLAYGIARHDVSGQVPRLVGAAMAQWPAAAVVAGVAAALFGVLPRATPVAWVLLGVFALLGQLGPLLRLSQPVMDASPFTHSPKLPGSGLSATPLVALTLIALALALAGVATFRRRDVT